jgi:hypothetical protein
LSLLLYRLSNFYDLFGLWTPPEIIANAFKHYTLYSCGDGTLGEPPRRGQGQCGNMRLLLRQQQRVSNSELMYKLFGAIVINQSDEYLMHVICLALFLFLSVRLSWGSLMLQDGEPS